MQNNHQIVISNKNKVEINSVTSVKTFDENGVFIESEFGNIVVEGTDMRIENLEKASSKIIITGNISGAFYFEKHSKKKGRGAV